MVPFVFVCFLYVYICIYRERGGLSAVRLSMLGQGANELRFESIYIYICCVDRVLMGVTVVLTTPLMEKLTGNVFSSKTNAVKTNRDCFFGILFPVTCQNDVLPSKCHGLLLIYYRFLLLSTYLLRCCCSDGWVWRVCTNRDLTWNYPDLYI